MQILPSDSADTSLGFFGASPAAADVADFTQSMQEALDSVRDGSDVSVTAALREDADAGRPMVESPYTRSTTDGVTYTLSEVCFTKQELAELRAQLLREGAPEESLRQFDILAGQPDGATLAQVMASLAGSGTAPKLSEDDEHAIIALLGKIDPSGDLAEAALAQMREGNGEAALELIAQGFARLAPNESIEISIDEALALGRGLGLDNGSLMGLGGNFGGFAALRVTAEQFGNLMAPANNQFMTDRANREKLDAALEKTLKPVITKARERMEKEKAASELQSRRVEQSRVLIDETVQGHSRGILDSTLKAGGENGRDATQGRDAAHAAAMRPDRDASTAESAAVSRKLDGRQSGMVGGAGREDSRVAGRDQAERGSAASGQAGSGQASGQPRSAFGDAAANADGLRLNAHGAHGAAGTGGAGVGLAGDTAQERDAAGSRDKDSKNGREWGELLGKVSQTTAQPAAQTIQTAASGSFLYTMLQGAGDVAPGQAQDAAHLPQLSRQVAQQVEQGMLQALRDGGTRLDLQLHPQELGALTITLVARNGEVSAQIRSEKSETADMVSRQIDAIRLNLEQQGIKVDKIEVQLENSADQNASDLWQDMGQHNARQEEDARREEMTRLRNLVTVRNNSRNLDVSAVEQPVHSAGQTARYAGQAMHLVA